MSKILLLFWTLLLFISPILSQPDPPQIILRNGIQASWTTYSLDPNFPDLPSNVTKYSNGHFRKVIYRDGKIFTMAEAIYLSFANGFVNSGGPDGVLLHCLDQKTGQVVWSNSNTGQNGNNAKEGYWGEGFRIRDDINAIEVIGYQNIDTTFPTAPKLAFPATGVHRTYDYKTGNLIDMKFGTNKRAGLHNFYGYGGNIIALGDDNYFSIQPNPTIEGSKLVENLYFFDISNNIEIDSNIMNIVKYKSDLPTNELSLSMGALYSRLDNNTLLAIFGVTNPGDDTQSPSKLEMLWIDISDKYHPKTVRTKDVHYSIQFPTTNDFSESPSFKAQDDNIIFHKSRYTQINGVGPKVNNMSLLWMDKDGNEKALVPIVEAEGYYYVYPEIIGVYKNAMYFSAATLIGGSTEYHILKINTGDNKCTKVSEFVMEDSNYLMLPVSWKIFDDGNIFSVAYIDGEIIVNDKTRNIRYTAFQSFKAKELRIDLEVNTTEVENIPCEIYPNPTSKFLQISTEATYNKIEIYDESGKLDLVTDKQENIDISGLSPGIKIVNLYNNNKIITSKKIVKIE